MTTPASTVGAPPSPVGRPGGASWGRKRGRRARGIRGTDRPGAWPYLLILPGFAFYAAFVLLPIFETGRLSFLDWNGLTAPRWSGFDNYRAALSDPGTWRAGLVALAFILFSCVLPVLVALVLAGLIARTKIRGLTFLRFVYFLPYTIALAVVAIAWRWIYATDGTVNLFVKALLGADKAQAYLGSQDLALPALGLVAFWVMFGFVVVMLLSGAQHIPRELYDAARADGAGPVREFFAVTVPGVRQELRVSLVLTFIMALRTFDLPLMTTSGGPGYATTTPSLIMYRDVFLNMQIGRGATVAVLLTVVIGAGVIVINRVFRSKD